MRSFTRESDRGWVSVSATADSAMRIAASMSWNAQYLLSGCVRTS